MHKCMHIYLLIYLNHFVYFNYVSFDKCVLCKRKIENKHLKKKKLAHYIHRSTQTKLIRRNPETASPQYK